MNKTGKTKKLSRLSNLNISEFMVENNIKTETKLFAIADEQKKAGKKDLANFVLYHSKIPGRWSLQAGKVFAPNKPIWKWFMSIPMGINSCALEVL